MGVVTVSTPASRASLGLSKRLTAHRSSLKRALILGFKADKHNAIALIAPHKHNHSAVETRKDNQKGRRSLTKHSKEVQAANTAEVSPYTPELDFSEAAARLENIYKLIPATDGSDADNTNDEARESRGRGRKSTVVDENEETGSSGNVVRNRMRRLRRLSLDQRIQLKKSKEENTSPLRRKKKVMDNEEEKIVELLQEYTASSVSVSLDWKKTKLPPVLSSSEQAWLFKLMEPMKALLQVKEKLQRELGRDPTDAEVGVAMNMSVLQVRRHVEVGRAARNKLIKHNLRLVLFGMNKYFQDYKDGPKFQDLCQAGVRGLITAIDRFEPKRNFQLSTYALIWIRNAIIRSMTVSSFLRVPFGLESVRAQIRRAKLELMFELNRMPTDEEISERVGISPERYQDVVKAAKPVYSLHSKHNVTQEEFIDGIADTDGVGDDKRTHPVLLRLALDDVLDSLKPKESLVVRQRYGLDGKINRSMGEIAGNLNISREMVRKYETTALMKLKHPARVDYLRRYLN